jgi:tRNA(Arg) A34 adenosine deaminase TadA
MQISQDALGLVQRFGSIHPEVADEIVDAGPTLENWANIRPTLQDMRFVVMTMACAYDAAVYSVQRHRRPETSTQAKDLPIGAAIGDPNGQFYSGYAQDNELADKAAHAEVIAIRHFRQLRVGESLAGLTLATTLEPCPACLEELDDSGISRVVYGASRAELEKSALLKRHGLQAPDIVREGRQDGKYNFEIFKFPNPAVQAACVEILASFQRDTDTGVTYFDPDTTSATRYNRYEADLAVDRNPNPLDEYRRRQLDEGEAILTQFVEVVDSFNGIPRNSTLR